MTDVNISELNNSNPDLTSINSKLYLKSLIFELAGSKAYSIFSKFQIIIWLAFVLDIILFYNLSFVGKTLFFATILLALKLSFVVGLGIFYGLIYSRLNIENEETYNGKTKGIDFALGLLLTWLLSSVMMLFSIIIMKLGLFGLDQPDIPEIVFYLLADNEIVSYFGTYFDSFFIITIVSMLTVFMLIFLKYIFVKRSSITTVQQNFNIRAFGFWMTCVILVSLMQAVTFDIWFEWR